MCASVGRARILLASGRGEQARTLLEAARESPFSTAEIDQQIDALLAQLPARSVDASGIDLA